MRFESVTSSSSARRRLLQLASAAVIGASLTAQAFAADEAFPVRPVHVYVPFAAGNTLDNALRQVAEEFRKNTGQPMIVENKPGGAGIIAAQTVARAPGDGYSLLLVNTSMLSINPYTFKKKLPYDTEKSFKPVTGFLSSTLVLRSTSPVRPPMWRSSPAGQRPRRRPGPMPLSRRAIHRTLRA